MTCQFLSHTSIFGSQRSPFLVNEQAEQYPRRHGGWRWQGGPSFLSPPAQYTHHVLAFAHVQAHHIHTPHRHTCTHINTHL